MPYLDLKVTNMQCTQIFDVFQKATVMNIIINNNSHHPEQHKLATVRSMLHRMNHLSLSCKDKQREMDTILTVVENNVYTTLHIIVLTTNFQRENNMVIKIIHPVIINKNG
jgi:hypothetical protein